MPDSTKNIAIGIIIFLLIIMIIYLLVMYELYRRQDSIFAPYVPPTPPIPYFYPLGTVTPLTPEEIEHRNSVIKLSLGVAP